MWDPCNGSRRKNTQLDERVKAAARATAVKHKGVKIMNYEEFKKNVLRDAENIARELIGDDAEVKIKCENVDGKELEMLKVGYTSGCGIGMNLRQLFDLYQKMPVWPAMIKALKLHIHNLLINSICLKGLKDAEDYQKAKEKLVIIPKSTKEMDILENSLGFAMDDIPMVVGLDTGVKIEAECTQVTAMLKKEVLDIWGVSKEQVLVDAMVNQAEKDKPVIMLLGEYLTELDPAFSCLHEDDTPLYVVTTESQKDGAKVISYPGFLDGVCEKLGGDIYIIPVSKHEVICLRDDLVRGDNNISDFISKVNRTTLLEDDVLSDHPYHYEKNTATFETMEAYRNRNLT